MGSEIARVDAADQCGASGAEFALEEATAAAAAAVVVEEDERDAEVYDAEVHLHNVQHVPRRGSVAYALLQWIPSAAIRAQLVALFSFPRSVLVALNAEEDPGLVLEALEWQRYAALADGINVTGALWTESTSVLGPQGLSNTASVAVIEARWLASQRLRGGSGGAPAPARVAGLMGQDLVNGGKSAQHQHMRAMQAVPGVRALRWVVNGPAERLDVAGLADAALLVSKAGLPLEVAVGSADLREVADIAEAASSTVIIVTQAGEPQHCGRPLENCTRYMNGLRALARQPNIYLKFSRLGAYSTGLGYSGRAPATAEALVRDWRLVFRAALIWFGPERLLFGSGFPLDGGAVPLHVFWQAAKTLVLEEVHEDKRRAVLSGNAQRLYGDATQAQDHQL